MTIDKKQATRARINWKEVFKTASSIRGQPCTSDGVEFSGGCNIIYRIEFEDGTRWALRIPHDEMPVEGTVATMRYVHSAVPRLPVATVHAWSDSDDGEGIGTRYMMLDWIEGGTLEWNASFPPPAVRRKILGQLAQHSVDLLESTSIQSSSQSALTWMLRKVDSRLTRIFSGNFPSFDPIDCLIFRAMAEEKYHIPILDALPFPLMHSDLNNMNFIVDDDYSINGILDWDDWACRLPLQCAVMCPAIISADNDPLQLYRRDRQTFMELFASAVDASNLLANIKAYLPPILADDELQIFHTALGSKGAYADWVAKYCVRSAQWIMAAAEALDRFLLAHPEMTNSPEAISVRARLLDMQGN